MVHLCGRTRRIWKRKWNNGLSVDSFARVYVNHSPSCWCGKQLSFLLCDGFISLNYRAVQKVIINSTPILHTYVFENIYQCLLYESEFWDSNSNSVMEIKSSQEPEKVFDCPQLGIIYGKGFLRFLQRLLYTTYNNIFLTNSKLVTFGISLQRRPTSRNKLSTVVSWVRFQFSNFYNI